MPFAAAIATSAICAADAGPSPVPIAGNAVALTRGVLLTFGNAFVRTLLAPACLACDVELHEPLRSPLCAGCWRSIRLLTPPTCVRCGDALPPSAPAGPECRRCLTGAASFAVARSAGYYTGALRLALQAYKFEGRRALAAPLARLLEQAGADLIAAADAAVPVPLPPWRSVGRGFNQADDLARQLGLPVWRALRRTGRGRPQSELPAGARARNVASAFVVRRPGCRRLRNRSVVLIDDVMTTGSTLDACARALLDGGVRTVSALTVARTASGRPAAPRRPRRPSAGSRR